MVVEVGGGGAVCVEVPVVSVLVLVPVVSVFVVVRLCDFDALVPCFGGGGGFLGRLTAPDEETVSVTTGPLPLAAVPCFSEGLAEFSFVAMVAVVAGIETVAPVSVVIAPPVAVVAVTGGAVAVDSLTVAVVSLLLVVFEFSDC